MDPRTSRCELCESPATRCGIENSRLQSRSVARPPNRAPRRWALAAACWLAAALSVGLVGVAVCPGGVCRVLGLDHEILAALHTARSPWLGGLLVPASWLGSIVVLLPAAVALWLWLRQRVTAPMALLPLLAVGGTWLLAHLTKLVVARPRPELFAPMVAMPDDPSFPSAHAAQAAAFAIAVVLSFGSPRAWTAVVAAASVLVALVALSRVYLQVHYPTDVLAGLVLGAGWTAGLWLLLGRAR